MSALVLLASTTSLWLKTLILLNSAAELLTPASGREGKGGCSVLGLAWTAISPAEKLLEQWPPAPSKPGRSSKRKSEKETL